MSETLLASSNISSEMWSNLPFDLLANVFSFLSPDSLACARSACRNWHTCANAYPLSTIRPSPVRYQPAWFVALPTRNHGTCCYAQNPITSQWHVISLNFLSDPIRPVASIGGLVLSRPTNCTVLQLVICNPFSREYRYLPKLKIARTNPAVGVVTLGPNNHPSPYPNFRVYVAGGMSEAPCGGATYESTLEMYDSRDDKWRIIGSMPMEFAVRLTVWTPNESVYCDGVLYWMTSARAYSVMGCELGSNKWHELSVPTADRIEFAALALRNGRLTLVGGTSDGEACVWEQIERGKWCVIEEVPAELGLKFLEGKGNWGSTRCVGGDGAICLYRELGSGMVVWREVGMGGGWEWRWVEGCCFVKGKQMQNLSIRGLFIHPNLSPSIHTL